MINLSGIVFFYSRRSCPLCSSSYFMLGLTKHTVARYAAAVPAQETGAPEVRGDNLSQSPTGPQENQDGVAESVSLKKRRRIKSPLLSSFTLWSQARITSNGQDRQEGQAIVYQLSTILLTIKLYKKSVLIDSVQQFNNSSSKRSFPVSAEYKDIDLKSYYTSLCRSGNWERSYGNYQFKTGVIAMSDFPFTVQMITLPFRLPGFKPSVIKQMLKCLDHLLNVGEDIGEHDSQFNWVIYRVTLAQVTRTIGEGNREQFNTGSYTLSKTLVREIRSILNGLSGPDRLNSKVLDLIKVYLFQLKSALHRLDRLRLESSQN